MNNILKENYINYLKTWKNIYFRADFHIIWWCNFKCIMCDNRKNNIVLNFTHNDILKAILTLKKEYNCNYIRFHWQEPTLYKNISDLILFSKKLWMKTSIKTNWWLLDDKKFIKILKNWLDELYLSIDWPNSNIHDKIRGIKWSFDKNIDLIIKWRRIKPDLKIYINSVILNQNYKNIDEMIDLWFKYNLDRVSFVFLNDKNRKDIKKINLNKKDFYFFFNKKILEIYNKANKYNLNVDFSPFFSDLSWKSIDYIVSELKNNFVNYKKEIENFYSGLYWKTFYDKYWCFWPIDHTSINYTWDIYGCCVVERDSSNSVWNIINENLKDLWNNNKYKKYRDNSNISCSYSFKCASNFNNRKKLFKDIYLDNNLYPKEIPLNYYRYLKELYYEDNDILKNIKISKLKNLLIHFYDNLIFYKELLLNKWISREDIKKINSLDFIVKLPILNKNILKKYFKEIEKLSIWKQVLHWQTSWNSWNKLDFFYPLDFKRHIRQIAIFSEETDFTYNDSYFSITPINCNQKIINNIQEPEYVKKIYINIFEFNFWKEQLININDIFLKNKNTNFIHSDPKYLLYIILWFKKFNLKLPNIKAVFSTYSYLNKSLKDYIKKEMNCEVFDNYWCSEVWPINIDLKWQKEIFWDNLILEEINNKIIVSDLDNNVFPFLRYENWDLWEFDWKYIRIFWKESQIINWKSLKDLDIFFYKYFKEIIFYQFIDNKEFIFFSEKNINLEVLKNKLFEFIWIKCNIKRMDDSFFIIRNCSKFSFIN